MRISRKAMDDLIKGVPIDEVTQAMIPSYQKHFTKSDIEAMNAFYSSPVGQKVLQQLPVVMQEGSQAAMPIISRYITDWKDRMQQDLKEMEKDSPKKDDATPPSRSDEGVATRHPALHFRVLEFPQAISCRSENQVLRVQV